MGNYNKLIYGALTGGLGIIGVFITLRPELTDPAFLTAVSTVIAALVGVYASPANKP